MYATGTTTAVPGTSMHLGVQVSEGGRLPRVRKRTRAQKVTCGHPSTGRRGRRVRTPTATARGRA